jgi:diphthamide synthase (EF-2-diphthine--ammonia ligase)
MNELALCSSSGGKDSLLAMWHAKQRGVRLTTLLTMFDETGLRNRSHGVPLEIVRQQASAMGLHLVSPAASWADYEKIFRRVIDSRYSVISTFSRIENGKSASAPQPTSLRSCHSGSAIAASSRKKAWRSAFAQSSFARMRAISRTTSVAGSSTRLPPNVDPCGENGEFHTFVYDGPLFNRRVDVYVEKKEEFIAPALLGGTRYCFARLA